MASSPQRGAPSAGGGRRPILYQIDFTAVASGKRIAATKRRVRWRFGFANAEAIAAGQTGTACRGEEHDVTLVWSLTSGKRMILADGQEVHYSNNRGNLFECSWTMRGNHVLKIVAHASPPMSPTPGFRQYDFFVNGLTFFSFPKVFRLGLPDDPRGSNGPSSPALAETSRRYGAPGRGPGGSSGPRRTSGSAGGSSVNIANLEAPGNPDEEEAYLQEAIRQSLKPAPKPAEPPAPAPPSDLLDFSEPVGGPPPAPPARQSIQTVGSDLFSLGETVQSDPYGGQGAAGHHQSFASLPALTGPSNMPPGMAYAPDYAAAAPGALVVSTTQSSAYSGYGAPVAANPYAPASSNPYAVSGPGSNPYGAAPAANPYGAPEGAPANPYEAAPAINPYEATAAAPVNPYGAAPTAPASNPYAAAPVATNPYGAPAALGAPGANPYEVQTPTANPYGAAPAYGTAAPPPAPAHSYGAAAPPAADKQVWTPPDRITTQPNPYDSTLPNPYNTFNGSSVPSAITPHAPSTPSTLGFGSPAPDFSGFSPEPVNGMPEHNHTEEVASSKSQPSSFIDQTFAKLAGFDTFSIESKKDAARSNPFELAGNSTIGGNKSLADIAKNKPKPAKEIMKTPVPAQAMVASATQSGYGGQYGMQQQGYGQQMPHGQGPAPTQQVYGQQQQPAMYGQPAAPPAPQQPSMVYGQPQQPYGQSMAQPAPPQQPYGQSMAQPAPTQQPYGQPMAQPAPPQPYGQAPPSQMYGQPPPPPQQQGYY